MGGARRPRFIRSVENETIKQIAALKQSKFRERQGSFLVEGRLALAEAVGSGAPVKAVVCTEGGLRQARRLVGRAQEKGAELLLVSDRVMEKLSDTETPPGVVAVVTLARPDLGAVLEGAREPLVVVADGVRDPGNLGTIIRTADAAGVCAVVVTPGTVDPFGPKVTRSAAGSLFHLAVVPVAPEELWPLLKRVGLKIVVTDPHGGLSCFEADLGGPVALVLGNETAGLAASTRRLADLVVRVPLVGRAESLNVSIAAAVVIYEALRQRMARQSVRSSCKTPGPVV